MRHTVHAATLLCAALLAACAQAPHRPLTADRAAVGSTDVVGVVKQREIYAVIKQSNLTAAAGGGLIFALIDAGVNSSRASTAEDSVGPVRDALVGYDFDRRLRQELDRSLAPVSWLHARPAAIAKAGAEEDLDGWLYASKQGAMLFVNTDYHLSADFSTLIVTGVASLFPRSEAFRAAARKAGVKRGGSGPDTALDNAAYYNTLVIESRAPGTGEDIDANASRWTANGGALLKRGLDVAATELANLVALDLQRAVPGEGAGEPYREGHLEGRVLRRTAAGTLVRFDDGTVKYLASLDARAPAPAPANPAPVAHAGLPTTALPSAPADAAERVTPPVQAPAPEAAPTPAPTAAPAPAAPPAPLALAPATAAPPAVAMAAPRVPNPPPATLLLEAPTSLRGRPTPDGSAVAAVAAGQTVNVVSTTVNASGYWLMVRTAAGQQGWMPVDPAR